MKQINISSLLLWIFSVIIAVVIPLIYSTSTVDITLVPQFIAFDLFILIFVALFSLFKIQRIYYLSINPVSILMLCYLLFSATSLIHSHHPQEGIFELMKIILWILLIIVLENLLKNKTEFKFQLIKAFAVASFVMTVIGALQITGLAFMNIPGHLIPYGTLGNRNIFVPALLLTLPFVIYEIMFATNKKWKMFAAVSGVLNITVVLASGMRTAILAVLISVIVSFVILIFFNKKFGLGLQKQVQNKIKICFAVFVLLGILTIAVVISKGNGNVNIGNSLSMNSTNERIALWEKSFKMFNSVNINF